MRVLLFGNSGSGKSTLARALAAEHGIVHLDLDSIVWEPDKIAVLRPIEAIRASLDAFLQSHEQWVIEGCYGELIEIAAPACTELIFLNPGREACLANNLRRPWEPHKYASKAEQDAVAAETVEPAPRPVVKPAPVSGPAKFTADELTALRMLTPAAYDLLSRAGRMLPHGADPNAAVSTAPVTLLLTQLAETVDMSAERLRALIRRLDPLLYRAGWMVRERWLSEPGVLNSVDRPGFGDRDFGTDRVGYAVVRAHYSTLPHNINASEEAA